MTVKTSSAFSDKPVLYKLPPKIVRDEDRQFTDRKYLIVFLVILVAWLVSCGFALYHADKSGITKKTDVRLLDDYQSLVRLYQMHSNNKAEREPWFIDMLSFYLGNFFDFNSHYQEMGSTFVWASVIFCSTFLVGAMGVLTVCAACNPAALLIISSILIAVSIAYHSVKYYLDSVSQLEPIYTKFMYWIGPEAVLFLFSLVVLLIATKIRGVSKMCDVMKKTFRYYLICRYVVLVGFVICFMIVLVNASTARVLENFNTNDVESKVIYCVIYSGSVYMMLLIHIFGRMIISATGAGYYWNENRGLSPFNVMCKKIFAVSKYQFGSACYKATYTSIWFTLVIGGLLRYEFSAYKLAKYCLIFDLLQLFTIDYTVYFIGMFGLPASEASKEFSRVFKKSRKHIIFVCQNFWSASFMILIPTNCLMLILMWGLDQHSREFSWVATRSYAEILCIFLPIIYVLSTIEDSRALCIMGESIDEREAMHAQMKAIKKAEKLEAIIEVEEPTQVLVIDDSNTDACTKLEQ